MATFLAGAIVVRVSGRGILLGASASGLAHLELLLWDGPAELGCLFDGCLASDAQLGHDVAEGSHLLALRVAELERLTLHAARDAAVGRLSVVPLLRALLVAGLAEVTLHLLHGALGVEAVVEADALAPGLIDLPTEGQRDRWDHALLLGLCLGLGDCLCLGRLLARGGLDGNAIQSEFPDRLRGVEAVFLC